MNQQEQNAEYAESHLALHKLYVEMVNAVSQRRDSANRFSSYPESTEGVGIKGVLKA